MKIVHVVERLSRSWGGLSLFVAELARWQVAAGNEVTLLCAAEADDDPDWVHEGAAVDTSPPGSAGWRSCLEASGVVHIHGLWLPRYHRAHNDVRHLKKPYVLSIHGMLEPGALEYSKWKKKLAWTLYQKRDVRKAPLLHATAEAEKQTLRRLGFRQPVMVCPPGVEIPESHECQISGRTGGDVMTALFLGRIHPKKGLVEFLEAWARVRPRNWVLQIGGPDERGHRAVLEQSINEQGLHGIQWLGPVFEADKARALASADLLVVPSRSENFGIVVAEGLAHGLPVLATTGTPWSSLADEGCGWWVDCRPDALAGALTEATLLGRDELAAMGARGRNLATREFAWRGIERRMREAYRWMMEGGEVPQEVDLAGN